MIWNPWKEIKRLRAEVEHVKADAIIARQQRDAALVVAEQIREELDRTKVQVKVLEKLRDARLSSKKAGRK